jgi:hypothetical protein
MCQTVAKWSKQAATGIAKAILILMIALWMIVAFLITAPSSKFLDLEIRNRYYFLVAFKTFCYHQ